MDNYTAAHSIALFLALAVIPFKPLCRRILRPRLGVHPPAFDGPAHHDAGQGSGAVGSGSGNERQVPAEAVSQRSPKRKSREKDIPPIRDAKRVRKEDPVEEFFEVLEEAIDQNAAREYMIDLLRDMEVPVDDRENEIEILSARIEFLNAQEEFAKDLEIQLNEDRATIEQYKKEIEKSLEEQKLLRFRKWQSRRHLSELLNQVYGLTNTFLFALDKSGKLNDGTMVTRGFTTALREAADCSRPLAAEWAQLEKLRRECHDMRGLPATADLPGGESNEDGSRENLWVKLHHAEMAYAKLRAHQDERERHFLGTIAHPFLIDIGRIRNHRRAREQETRGAVRGGSRNGRGGRTESNINNKGDGTK